MAFATSEVTFIKLFGLGLAMAVLVDASLVRAALVPAFMRLAGRANWWAPAPMARFYQRFGLTKGEGAPAAPSPPAGEPSGNGATHLDDEGERGHEPALKS